MQSGTFCMSVCVCISSIRAQRPILVIFLKILFCIICSLLICVSDMLHHTGAAYKIIGRIIYLQITSLFWIDKGQRRESREYSCCMAKNAFCKMQDTLGTNESLVSRYIPKYFIFRFVGMGLLLILRGIGMRTLVNFFGENKFFTFIFIYFNFPLAVPCYKEVQMGLHQTFRRGRIIRMGVD